MFYKNTVMKESQIAAMDEFADNIQILINVLGYKVLEPIARREVADSKEVRFYLSVGAVEAGGVETPFFQKLKEKATTPLCYMLSLINCFRLIC